MLLTSGGVIREALARAGFVALLALPSAGCESTLAPQFDGLQCDEQGRCLPGYHCNTARVCVRDDSDEGPPAASGCREGEAACGAECVVLASSPQHCGGCGATCTAPTGATAVCVDAECAFVCQSGFMPCGASCVDAAKDVLNCGGCGRACEPSAGATTTCEDGSCRKTCAAPYFDCGGRLCRPCQQSGSLRRLR